MCQLVEEGRGARECLVGVGGQRTGPFSEKWLLTFDLVG